MKAPHPDQVRWDQKYRQAGMDALSQEASPWLTEHQNLLARKGKALDIACGNGRNSRFLAQMGLQVDAVDISEVAIHWLTEQMASSGLAVEPRCMDILQCPFPSKGYQVILNINFLERGIFARMEEALAPGGLLLFETFLSAPNEKEKTNMNPRFLLAPNELAESFSGMEILDYRENPSEKGRWRAGLVARKT